MRLYAGTSGFSYDEWKGVFYPEDLAADDRLRFYAERLPAVEINNTFYRLPKKGVLESSGFRLPGFPPILVHWDTVAYGIGLAALMGAVSGILPAWQASKLKIVDALRKVA